MNVYAWIVLVALLGEFILSVVTSVLNVRAMSPAVPDAFRAAYDDDAYARSQAYTRVRSWLGLCQGTASLVALLLRFGIDASPIREIGSMVTSGVEQTCLVE